MFKPQVVSADDEDICILIKVDNHSNNYICECGEAKRLSVKDCQNTKAIFISHTHIDHFANFDTILRHQIGTQKNVIIVGPMGIIDQVQNRIKSYCWNLIEEGAISYEIREIQEAGNYTSALLRPPLWLKEQVKEINSEVVFVENDFDVKCVILDHKTDSIAYLFKAFDRIKVELNEGFQGGKWVKKLITAYEEGLNDVLIEVEGMTYLSKDLFSMLSKTKGETLGIIMDHAASEANHDAILALFSECDQVYIECFYKDEDKDLAIKNHHSFATKSGEISKRCNIKCPVPVHFSRKYSDEDIVQLISQFNRARS